MPASAGILFFFHLITKLNIYLPISCHTRISGETAKAQDVLDEIKYSMNFLKDDLKGIKVDEEV